MPHVGLTDLLEAGGPLARALQGYERRPEQLEMASAVAAVLDEGGALAVEAGTGIGKTLAYLAPAALSGLRVVVSTATKTLQEQLVHKDLPLLHAHLGVPFASSMLKGRGNYLCLLRLDERRRNRSLFDDEDIELDRIARWARTTETGDRAELSEHPDDWSLWRDINSTVESCVGHRCPHHGACFVMNARRAAAQSDIIVVNHHLYFADLSVRGEAEAALLPAHDAVIFDEAHQLEEVACSFFGDTVSTHGLKVLRTDAERSLGRIAVDEAGLRTAAERLDAAAARLFGLFGGGAEARLRLDPDDLPGDLEDAHVELDTHLEHLSVGFERLGEKHDDLLSLARRARDLRGRIARVLDVRAGGDVHWVDRRRTGTSLHRRPIDAAPILQRHLFPMARSLVFTSATLSTEGNLSFFRSRLGIEDGITERILPSSFDYRRQALLYLPEGVPEPSDMGFVDAVCDEIETILTVSKGRAFVLFTSYENLNATYQRLTRRLPFPMLRQGDRPRDALLKDFRAEESSVLFATASFWEGVDVAGSSLSCVIIDKLPFEPPNDPPVQARMERIQEAGRSPFRDYQLPVAILALRQGFGRLIRRRTDRGIVAVLDPRLRTRAYGRRFLASLPDCERTSDPSRLAEWARAHLDG